MKVKLNLPLACMNNVEVVMLVNISEELISHTRIYIYTISSYIYHIYTYTYTTSFYITLYIPFYKEKLTKTSSISKTIIKKENKIIESI